MSARTTPPADPPDEEKQLGLYIAHVEKKVMSAPDERTRGIRLMVLALAEAARSQMAEEES